MMRAPLFFIAMIAGVNAATAEDTIKLRAGEHADYSRVVIPDLGQQWRVSATGREVEVIFSGETPEFDLSDLTEKHKAHRVRAAKLSMRGEQRVLSMTLACDCSVNAAQNYSKAIIIDIFDGKPTIATPARPDVATASAEINVAEERATAASPQPDVAAESDGNNAANDSVAAVAPQPGAPTILVRDNMAEVTTGEIATDQASQKPTPENLAAARDRMIALLAEARARGVVQIKNGSGGENVLNANSQTENSAAVEDAASKPADGAPEETVTCIDPARFSDRPQEGRDYAKIIALREETEKAVGEERFSAGRELAAAYLRIGFFDEASAVALSTANGQDGELMLAAALAEIAGATKANAAKTISRYAECGPTYEMLHAALLAKNGAEYAAGLSDLQINALNAMMRSLRGPIAEIFALNAVDHDETALLTRYYEIASRARAPELTPALAIIEAALPDASTEPGVIDEPLMTIAQTPGPMQMRALGELAAQYENDATIAYEGFLEDLTAQKSEISGSRSDARASFAGAKALASAGRIVEGIDLLANVASSTGTARGVARSLAQSILMDALAGENDTTRLLAVSAFLQHRDFIASETGRDDELVLSVAREVADLGSTELTDDIINASSHKRARPESNVIRAKALLNAGADQSALALAEELSGNAEATVIAARAGERVGDNSAVTDAVKRALRRGEISKETAAAAWSIGEWKLAADAYTMLASDNVDDGARLALAAVTAGAKSMPEVASRALVSDPKALKTAQHMFTSAPYFSPATLEDAAAYADGVASEAARIRERLNDE